MLLEIVTYLVEITKFDHSTFFRQKCAWAYDRDAAFFGKRGAGNNWAFGYSHYGNEMTEHILNMMQRVSEKMEQRLASFFVAMSLAGGTGSGLGTKVRNFVPFFADRSVALPE